MWFQHTVEILFKSNKLSENKWSPTFKLHQWASYQVRKIAGCACTGNAGNVFRHHRLQRKPLVIDPDMHHGTCVTHVPWCMSGSLTHDGGENVPGIPGACANLNFTYLTRGLWQNRYQSLNICCWWPSLEPSCQYPAAKCVNNVVMCW